ncbi:uncharacterized protein AMSG_11842 [Thecamonas trahens ATCC 50062]|uniref:Uncharacterized protein n=1 Tax=Thecamonas trahens ATCC 50062 TaxID=461836 RepID=A0A0L0D9K9_THETB|nr:hypothetical protein AMSG_11842 [Thecamonas trahens ATCC 50062]KNC49052.1 hypothetical protein AMSG_11842 [Thecamonas trahens ATCC 50062]|eukprot:XP_013758221.1 hypothetical protein AMSG_11842 [Thecamonas trahens ATCC 50062]
MLSLSITPHPLLLPITVSLAVALSVSPKKKSRANAFQGSPAVLPPIAGRRRAGGSASSRTPRDGYAGSYNNGQAVDGLPRADLFEACQALDIEALQVMLDHGETRMSSSARE